MYGSAGKGVIKGVVGEERIHYRHLGVFRGEIDFLF